MDRGPPGKAGLASLAGLLLFAASAGAETVTVYRCVDASGRVALQDQPCPPGQLDRRSEARLDPASPATPVQDPVPEPPPAESASPPPEPPPIDPPPPLWRCVDFEGKSRLSPRDDPDPRYVPYWVVAGNEAGPRGLAGRGGRPAPRAGGEGPGAPRPEIAGALPPMVLVEDRCRQFSPGQACRAYRELRDEMRRREFNGIGDARREAAAEVERLRSILADHCGG
ncbi:DUF4124 domain-containing protein [Pseudomarimonas salicorniae]|uniref:DUF4124 domain-containing protein n=1 Tax=Pseudomarimonas salicorniae TaxID=2933270 RepID=A0ABT0GCS7_9GAMM|nr:DUF4124 domain-containing protein [Lysobacter sp. CAU 1642]MCK7592340.1 DUF4124 domain-containing protein [Lysobacter sp. CAU 1642]